MKTILSCAIGCSAPLCAAACQADLAAEQRRDFTAARDLGFRFEQDLNGDGNHELLLVGDYGAIDSRRTFALIASAAAHEWSRAALFEFPEKFIVGTELKLSASPARPSGAPAGNLP